MFWGTYFLFGCHFGTLRPGGAAIHSATFRNVGQARDAPSLRTWTIAAARWRRAATTDTSAVATATAVLSPSRARARHEEAS